MRQRTILGVIIILLFVTNFSAARGDEKTVTPENSFQFVFLQEEIITGSKVYKSTPINLRQLWIEIAVCLFVSTKKK